jgi:hypothetical protein
LIFHSLLLSVVMRRYTVVVVGRVSVPDDSVIVIVDDDSPRFTYSRSSLARPSSCEGQQGEQMRVARREVERQRAARRVGGHGCRG